MEMKDLKENAEDDESREEWKAEVSTDDILGNVINELAPQISFFRRMLSIFIPSTEDEDDDHGAKNMKPSKLQLAFGIYYYLSMIITDFALCVIYIIERDELYLKLYDMTPANMTSSMTTIVPVDNWYESMRPVWMRWTVFALVLFRSIPFAIEFFRTFGTVLFTPQGFVSVVTLIPGLMLGSPITVLANLWFPYFLRCWSIVRDMTALMTFLGTQKGNLNASLESMIFVMVLRIASVLYTCICLFNFTQTSWSYGITMFECLYFSVVTLSTVGYGDILPTNVGSKLITMGMIICIFAVVPSEVNQLVDALNAKRANGGSFEDENVFGKKKHVVVCGSSLDDVNFLDILNYFEIQRSKLPSFKNYYTFVVFLFQKEASPTMKKILASPSYKYHVKYLIGSGTDPDDLARASVETAEAVFVLSDYYDDGLTKADERNAFRVWTIHDLYPHLPIYIYNLKEATTVQFKDYPRPIPGKKKKHHHKKDKDHKEPSEDLSSAQIIYEAHEGHPKKFAKVNISNQYLKQAMIGTNCLIRSSIPFVANLFKLSDPFLGCKEEWMKKYGDGTGNELYQHPVPARYVGNYFQAAASEMFEKFEILLFAVKTKVGDSVRVVLNPGSQYIFKEDDNCFYIAQDDEQIDEAFVNAEKPNVENKQASIQRGIELIKNNNPYLSDILNPKVDIQPRYHDNELYENWEKLTSIQSFPLTSHDSNLPLCHLLNESKKFDDIKVSDGESFHNHYIVIANGIKPEGLLPFCAVLRAPYLHKNDIPEILIVSADEPSEDQCDDLLNIPHLYIMTTRCSKERDLLSIGLLNAKEVIIFSNPTNWQSGDEPIMVDRSAITITNKIRSLCGDDIKLTVELVYRSNWKFIPPKPTKDDFDDVAGFNYLFTPAYVCGNIFSPTLIEGLLYQSYLDRPDLAELVSLLLGIKPVENNITEKLGGLSGSYLRQIPVQPFIGTEKKVSFGTIFAYLIGKDILVLGIYKQPGGENGYGYIHTNPSWKTPVNEDDKLLVLVKCPFDFKIEEKQQSEPKPSSE